MAERRSDCRFKLELPAIIHGESSDGSRFTEKTTLENLSSTGAYFFLENQLLEPAELQLHIDPKRSGLTASVRIVRCQSRGNKKEVGVCIVASA